MAQLEDRLKKRVGSEYLIGCYSRRNGQGVFVDIRGVDGEIISSNDLKGHVLEIPYTKKTLMEKEFYSFKWHVADEENFLFAIDGDPVQINKPEFLGRLFDVYVNKKGKDLADSINFQNTIFSEVTGAEHTYIYELLQNANDYPYETERDEVAVKFILTKNYLLFLHSGSEFNLRNIVGICSINQGEKKGNTETIGYKGIGFKTVFVNNDFVYLRSGEWKMRFDKAYSEDKAAGECAWSLMPIPTEDNQLDDELRLALKDIPTNYRVQFALRHKSDATLNIPQLEKVFADNQILLFIPHVAKAEVIISGKQRFFVEKDKEKWVVTPFKYPVPENLKAWVNRNIEGGSKIPEKFKDITNIGISFAVSRNGREIVPVNDARVYNYLPTELRLGFNFLINADFVPNGSRSGLHDVPWNDNVMEECGRKFVDWWSGFFENEGEWDMNSVFTLIPDFSSKNPYAGHFMTGFMDRMPEVPCIPVNDKGEYRLCKIQDIIFDNVGLVSGLNPVLSDEEFYQFTGTNKHLPHKSIRNNEYLKDLLTETFSGECQEFDGDDLASFCQNAAFNKWMCIEENNIRFNKYMIQTGFMSNLNQFPVFLTEDGVLAKVSDIYLDVDKYLHDISFVSDFLPRLNTTVRTALETESNWHSVKDKFKHFSDYRFAQELIESFGQIKDRLEIKDNNIGFVRFIARSKISAANLPHLGLKLFSDKDELVNINKSLFIKSEIAEQFYNQSWVNRNWLNFVSDDYFANDPDSVYPFMKMVNVRALRADLLFGEFVANNNYVPEISESIKEKTSNIAFYLFMAENFSNISKYKLTRQMRDLLVVYATNGYTESIATIGSKVYFSNEDWEKAISEPWMPSNICLAISDCYNDKLNPEKSDVLKRYMQSASIAFSFTMGELGALIKTERHTLAICNNIKTKEDSKSFLEFLYRNNHVFFGQNESISQNFQKVPLLWDGHEEMMACSDIGRRAYFHTNDLDYLCEQEWFDETKLYVCDHHYDSLFDGRDRQYFFSRIGIRTFQLVDYFHKHILAIIGQYQNVLSERSANFAFHHFLYGISSSLTKDDFDKLKIVPIYISSPEYEEGELSTRSDGHYLPSEFLNDIIKKDLVPIDYLDAVHPDYIHNDQERQYYKEYLGNVEIDEDNFVKYIVKIKEDIEHYLKEDKNRNIRFWRWVCDANLSFAVKSALSVFPMIGYSKSDSTEVFLAPKDLFISAAYSDVKGIEEFIAEFTEQPHFVSSAYIEDDDNRNWDALFRAIHLTTDTRSIVFKHILPHLEKFERKDIVQMLAQHEREIVKELQNNNEKIINELSSVRLLCSDGLFRYPKDSILSGLYFDIEENPFPEIRLGNIVTESYINEEGLSPDNVNRIKRLLIAIADSCGQQKNTLTSLRQAKLSYYIDHQKEHDFEEHIAIIAQLAKCYSEDPDGVRDICKGKVVYLYDTQQILHPSGDIYLSSCYNPDCDFMGNGITNLNYLHEAYIDVISRTERVRLFDFLRLKQYFNAIHIDLLKNSVFAVYFWTKYAPSRETLKDICNADKLRLVYCIPSPLGIKRPVDLYDYRDAQLQKMVRALKNGEDKLPNINLPRWVEKIGLLNHLSLPDCLEYLRLDTNDYRRGVLNWIIETKDETLHRFRHEICEYIDNANWYNGQKQWVPLKSLVALEWNNDTLKNNFSSNGSVCNPSFMPEYKQDYDRLCKIFDIKVLTNADFKKKKSGEWKNDDVAKNEIRKRLLYLAFNSGKEDWQKTFEYQAERLDNCEICSCEQIDYFYNDNITTELMSFTEDDDKLWYVGKWDGMMFLDILEWVKRVFAIRRDLQDSYLKKLFGTNFNKFLKSHEHDLPQEFLDYLDEASKDGILVEQEEKIEEFEEENDTSASLDENLVNKVKTDISGQNQNNIDESENRTIDDDDRENDFDTFGQTGNPDSQNNDEEQEPEDSHRERKTRSDKGGQHKTHQRTESSQYSNDGNTEDSSKQKSDAEPEKDVQSKLKEKWEKKANREVHRPFSHSNGDAEPFVAENSDNSFQNQGEFFEEDHYDSTKYGNNSETSKAESKFKRKNTEAHDNAEKAEEELEISELLATTPRYTYLWFKYLMELMYADKSNLGIRTTRLDFFAKEIVCDGKVLRLLNPSHVVPTWVENADNVQLFAFKDGVSHKVKGSIIKVDDLSVDFMLDVDNNDSMYETSSMYRLQAENSMNIIDSLNTRFLQLGYDDEFDMNANLPEDIKFIYGPPGTGKTTWLVSELHRIIKEAPSGTNVLVLTPTNKAADVIAKRMLNDDICYDYMSRFGATEDTELIEEGVVTTRDTMDVGITQHNIVVTTAARYSYDTLKFDDEDIFLCDYNWDYIVVDEASMIDIVTMCFILHKGCMENDTSFIVAGDPKQIQPITQNDVDVENIYQMIGINDLGEAIHSFKRFPIVPLLTQYRSVPVIGELVSKFAYNGMVKSDTNRDAQKPLCLDGISTKTINFIGFDIKEFDNLYELGAIGGSAFNLYSAIFTYNMVSYTAKQIADKYTTKEYTIGVVCPYRAQADAIRQMIEERPIDQHNCHVSCGTVHSFQGDECDLMFVVLNPPANVSSGSHINNQNIINVAMSRARDYLFFIVPKGQIHGFQLKNRLGQIIDNKNREVLYTRDLEKVIFGEDDYIFNHTAVTCHMPVNVYYESSAEYEVRIDDNAMDIQINDIT